MYEQIINDLMLAYSFLDRLGDLEAIAAQQIIVDVIEKLLSEVDML